MAILKTVVLALLSTSLVSAFSILPRQENTTLPVSTDGTCSASNTCVGSAWGDCCSTFGFCGNGTSYCGVGNCVSGSCLGSTANVTTDGTCGPSHGNTICGDTAFGSCCSTSGYCGSDYDHCGLGLCVSGACDTTGGGVTPDGSCGPSSTGNYTCTGSTFGACCSKNGYCGSTSAYCSAANCISGACDSS